jgi:hypothetical protein
MQPIIANQPNDLLYVMTEQLLVFWLDCTDCFGNWTPSFNIAYHIMSRCDSGMNQVQPPTTYSIWELLTFYHLVESFCSSPLRRFAIRFAVGADRWQIHDGWYGSAGMLSIYLAARCGTQARTTEYVYLLRLCQWPLNPLPAYNVTGPFRGLP